MSPPDAQVPYGTLDLMVLNTLAGIGPLHGFGIARRIEQASDGALALNQGTIYPALLRLEQKGWIKSAWGTSEQPPGPLLRNHGRGTPAARLRNRALGPHRLHRQSPARR